MKNLIKNTLLVSSICLCGAKVVAKPDLKYTMGLDVARTQFSFVKAYGKEVFGKNPTQFNFFGQYKLSNNFFIEYGYGYMPNKAKKGFQPGDVYPGHTVDNVGVQRVVFNSKITMQFPYLGIGWNYYLKSLSNTYFSLFSGISIVKIYGKFEMVSDILDPDFSPEKVAQFRRTFSNTKPSLLLKAAINHKFTDHWGIRLIGMWHRLSHFNNMTSKHNRAPLKLQNATGVGLGIFYNF